MPKVWSHGRMNAYRTFRTKFTHNEQIFSLKYKMVMTDKKIMNILGRNYINAF